MKARYSSKLLLVIGPALLAMLWVDGAEAQNAYSMVGGWRSIRGTGTVNIPFFGTFPENRMPTASAIQQTGGTITIPPHLFNFPRNTAITPNFGNPGHLVGVSAFPVRQLRTNFSGAAPLEKMVLAPSGRSGPDVASICPGTTQPGQTIFNGTSFLGYNPFCTAVNGTPNTAGGIGTPSGMGVAHGLLRYSRAQSALQKGAQFGGVGQAGLIGTGDLGVVIGAFGTQAVNTQPPFTNAALWAWNVLFREGAEGFAPQASGQTFGATETAMLAAGPGNFIFASTGALGIVDPSGVGGGLGPPLLTENGGTIIIGPDLQTAWGGPWTTGNILISVTKNRGAAIGNTHVFTLMGTDQRTANGSGMIQLVTGNTSRTNASGPSGNRAIVRMNFTNLPEPSMWLSASGALLVLIACRRLTRRG